MKTDIELQRDVLYALEWEPTINAAEIGVTVDSGVVTLAGHVGSTQERSTAEHIAERVQGVRAVANEIAVQMPVSESPRDPDIARTAIAALSWDLQVPEERVKVVVSNGWISLEGFVDWEYQKRAAEEAVRNLTGVRGVNNQITVIVVQTV
jgi:osmotically-inducible protein OsmY